jgi:hypothetical protein
LSGCSRPIYGGTMREERDKILRELEAIDPNL